MKTVDIEQLTLDWEHGLDIKFERIGILYEDIEKYNLLSNPIKETDSRSEKYQFEKQVEIDALPPNVLVNRVESAIIAHLDMDAYRECLWLEKQELNVIRTRLGAVQGGE